MPRVPRTRASATAAGRPASPRRAASSSATNPPPTPTPPLISGRRPRSIGTRVGANLHVRGRGQHLAVALARREQLGVRPVGDDASAVEQHDPVSERDGRGSVGDDERRPALHHLTERGTDLVLLRRVDRRRRVVEDQHPRLRDHRACDRHPLALPARQRVAVLADLGAEAVREPVDELLGAGEPSRAPHLLHRRVGIGERDVVAHRAGEEERLLEHDPDVAAEVVEPQVAHVDAVDQHPSAVDVVEPGDEPRDGRLARCGRTDDRDRFAAPQDQVEAVEHRRSVAVAERDVLEAAPRRRRPPAAPSARAGSTISGSACSASSIRDADATARAACATSWPSTRIGMISIMMKRLYAMSWPTSSCPSITRWPPYQSTASSARLGMKSTSGRNPARRLRGRERAVEHRVGRDVEALDLLLLRAEALDRADAGDALLHDRGEIAQAILELGRHRADPASRSAWRRC